MTGLAPLKVDVLCTVGGVPAKRTPEFGALPNWSMVGVVIFVSLGLKLSNRGMLSVSAIMTGRLAGYAFAFVPGQVVLGDVGSASSFAFPNPLYFSVEFCAVAIIGFCLMSFVSAVQTGGDVSGITKGVQARRH